MEKQNKHVEATPTATTTLEPNFSITQMKFCDLEFIEKSKNSDVTGAIQILGTLQNFIG